MSGARNGLLARAQAWLIEPATEEMRNPDRPALAPAVPVPRPLVAICGIDRGCGVTTVARALAAELAGRDPQRAAVVAGTDGRGALPLGSPAAARLARLVSERAGVEAMPSGRLCVVRQGDPPALERALRGVASVVFDLGGHDRTRSNASLADEVLLVAGPRTEPALAEILAASLGRGGSRALVILNRFSPAEGPREKPDAWEGRADIVLPSSVPAARVALACRGTAGAFGAAIASLADRCVTR